MQKPRRLLAEGDVETAAIRPWYIRGAEYSAFCVRFAMFVCDVEGRGGNIRSLYYATDECLNKKKK